MNKSDVKLLLVVLLVFGISIFLLSFFSDDATKAFVYYDGNLIKEISLAENGNYEVDGELGVVYITVLDKKIKVNEETSPLHLCSKQGFISNRGESIICLPNKIVIELEDDTYDAIIK